MALFPEYDSIKYKSPLQVEILFKTLTSIFDDLGTEKRRRKWLFCKRNITLVYGYLSNTDANTLWAFYIARYGAYESFSFFLKDSNIYEDEYIGIGDGSTYSFDIPGKSTSARTVYLNNSPQNEAADATSAGDYYVTSNGGTDGADLITFFVAPTDGYRIKIDFTGILRIRCRFNDDNLTYEELFLRLTNMGIMLQGLNNDE